MNSWYTRRLIKVIYDIENADIYIAIMRAHIHINSLVMKKMTLIVALNRHNNHHIDLDMCVL